MPKIPQFKAPWSRELWFMTVLSVAICVGIPCILVSALHDTQAVIWIGALIPIVILIGAAAFSVRGYSVEDDRLWIHRPGWSSSVPLSGLIDAEADPDALQKSIRLFGNGGAFSFLGWIYNKKLGRFFVYGTDPSRSVVLIFPQRKLVVTPDDPSRFASVVRKNLSPNR